MAFMGFRPIVEVAVSFERLFFTFGGNRAAVRGKHEALQRGSRGTFYQRLQYSARLVPRERLLDLRAQAGVCKLRREGALVLARLHLLHVAQGRHPERWAERERNRYDA